MIIRATVSYVTYICYLSIRGNRSLELFKKLYPRIGIEESTMKNYQYVTIPYFVSISTAPYYAPEYSSVNGDLQLPVPTQVYYPPENAVFETVNEPSSKTHMALPSVRKVTTFSSLTPITDLKKDIGNGANTIVIRRYGSRLGRSMNGFDILLPRSVLDSMWRVMCDFHVIVVRSSS